MSEQGEVMSNREGTVATRMELDGGSGEMIMDVGPTLPWIGWISLQNGRGRNVI